MTHLRNSEFRFGSLAVAFASRMNSCCLEKCPNDAQLPDHCRDVDGHLGRLSDRGA